MSTVETAVGRFVWHDQISNDPAAASRFYSDLLGWEIEVSKPGEIDYPMIKSGEQTHGDRSDPGRAPPHWLAHVLVDDVDAAVGRVEGAGGKVVAPAMDIPEVGRMAVIADPQGAIVSLFASAGDPPTSQGVFVWDELLTTDIEVGEALLRRGRRLGEPRDGDGRRQRLHVVQLGRHRPRGRNAHSPSG